MRAEDAVRTAPKRAGAGRRAQGEELLAVAGDVQRLGVLLAAGVAPGSAWTYLAEDDAPVARTVADRLKQDTDVAAAILAAATAGPAHVQPAWRAVAAAWAVATSSGAPLAPTLERMAEALRDLAQTRQEVQGALAAPAATARLVMLLPAVGVVFGSLLGFDTVRVLFATPAGWMLLVAGLALLWAGRGWSRRLLKSAEPATSSPGLVLDLVAIAVSGGAPVARAVELVSAACESCAIPVPVDGPEQRAVRRTLALSERAGVPAALLLRTEAADNRRAARNEGAQKAAVLAVTLMLPLGLCVLPAFMVLGVAPLMLAVVTSTVGAF